MGGASLKPAPRALGRSSLGAAARSSLGAARGSPRPRGTRRTGAGAAFVQLGSLTWPDAGRVAPSRLLAVPVGATEQHGPHLPLDTDTRVAVALAEALAARRPDVVVAPALPYGSSGEHRGFAGTLSIGAAALELVVVELVRSADAFAGAVVVSGHGGNAAALRRACARLVAEGRRALCWWPKLPPGGDAHAGRTETSLLLALHPAAVRMALAASGETRPLSELSGPLRSLGVAAVSPSGVLGDPTGATAAEGRRLLAAFADELAATVARMFPLPAVPLPPAPVAGPVAEPVAGPVPAPAPGGEPLPPEAPVSSRRGKRR